MKPNPKTSYDKREILSYCVHHPTLPRRLPAPPLLMFDRITEIHAGRRDRNLLSRVLGCGAWLVA